MDQGCSEAYLLSHEIHKTLGNYQPSPYRPWSPGDMALLGGGDESSGEYLKADNEQSSASPSPQSQETQLSLF